MDFAKLLNSVNSIEEEFPPVHLWNPELCQGVEMKIDREGNWFYQGSIIDRKKLKVLFSRILKLENSKYFLVTPVEKVAVKVDLAPYMIVDYEVDDSKTKMKILNITESPDKFETKENWPELFDWNYPHLFIVSDSFFPDY